MFSGADFTTPFVYAYSREQAASSLPEIDHTTESHFSYSVLANQLTEEERGELAYYVLK